jgi:hypothetical protein
MDFQKEKLYNLYLLHYCNTLVDFFKLKDELSNEKTLRSIFFCAETIIEVIHFCKLV